MKAKEDAKPVLLRPQYRCREICGFRKSNTEINPVKIQKTLLC